MTSTVSGVGWFHAINTTNAIATPTPRRSALERATKLATAPAGAASAPESLGRKARFHQPRTVTAADDGPTTHAAKAITSASTIAVRPAVRRKLVSWSQTAPAAPGVDFFVVTASR